MASAAPVPRSLLVVDDDPQVLSAFRRITRDMPLMVRFARTAEEAWQLVEAEQPQLVICDYRLPGLDGVTFLERLHEKWPLVRRILYTGEAVNRIIYGF